MRPLRLFTTAVVLTVLATAVIIAVVGGTLGTAGPESIRNVGRHVRAWVSARLQRIEIPQERFFLFGMGNRKKLLYRSGKLVDLFTGEVLAEWQVQRDFIYPPDYTVVVETVDGESITICEDEDGVWIVSQGLRRLITGGSVALPTFDEHPHAALLRQLLHEVLINIVDGRPLPNLLVYSKPWYRDAAIMAMVLQKTGNLHLVQDWIRGLSEPFDYNNGNAEPDNLGQVLYLISLVSDKTHPLVQTVLDAASEYKRGDYIVGITDGAEHPVYQTAWLKFGLKALGLPDPFRVPDLPDSYSTMLWMMPDIVGSRTDGRLLPPSHYYPYLAWARDHYFRRRPTLPVKQGVYPASYEAHASQADYSRMAAISESYVTRRIAAPHAWHAAEMFLYYLDVPHPQP